MEKEPKKIQNGGYAIVIIKFYIGSPGWYGRPYEDKTIKRYYFEKYKENSFLGSFELFNEGLIAVGSIIDINVI